MMRGRKITLTLMAIMACTTMLASIAPADDITIGTPPGDGQDCIPFGCGLRAQMVYDASFFSGPILIDTMTFYNSEFDSPDTFDPATYTFKLSTTSAADGTLSSTMSANIGPDEAVFGVFAIGGGAVPASFSFVGTPFLYDPSAGNLLLEVSKPDGADTFSAFTDNSSPLAGVSRVWNGDGSDTGIVNESYATVVTFSGEPPAPVPEPATLTLAGLGLVGFAGAARLKRRKNA